VVKATLRMVWRRAPLLALAFTIFAAPAPTRKNGIESAAAAADFRLMNAIFSQAHATAFKQIPKGDVPDIFKDAGRVSIRDFIARVLAYYRGIKVDHTQIGFSSELIEELGLGNTMFPFPLKFFDGNAHFDCEYHDIPFGSELTHINGRPMVEILRDINKVFGIQSVPGKWDDYRLEENFSFLYYIARGEEKEWSLSVRPPRAAAARVVNYRIREGGNAPRIQRASLSLSQYQQPLVTMYVPRAKSLYFAVNTFMPSMNQLDSFESWHNYLSLLHNEANARKPENLIIDLRQNKGGVMNFSAFAAQWFLENPLTDKSRNRIRTRMLPFREHIVGLNAENAEEMMLKRVEQHMQDFYSDKMQDGYFEVRNNDATKLELKPVRGAYKFRRIVVLMGPATYSAAVNFARLLKIGNPNVTLVGQETGSPGSGHAADILVTYRLPVTALLILVPLAQVDFFPLVNGQQQQRGLMPDIVVKDKADDFAQGRDTLIEHATQLLNSGK